MPNNYQYPSTENSQSSQTFPTIPLPPNNFTVFPKPPTSSSGAQSLNDEVDTQCSIQIGLENITHEE